MPKVIFSYEDYATDEEIDEYLKDNMEDDDLDDDDDDDDDSTESYYRSRLNDKRRYEVSQMITEWNWECFLEDLGTILKNYEGRELRLDGYNLDWRNRSGFAQIYLSPSKNSYSRGIDFLRETMPQTHIARFEISVNDEHADLWMDPSYTKPIPFSIYYCHHDANSTIDVMVYKPSASEIIDEYAEELQYMLGVSPDAFDSSHSSLDILIDDTHKIELEFDFKDDSHSFVLKIDGATELSFEFTAVYALRNGAINDIYDLGIDAITDVINEKLKL